MILSFSKTRGKTDRWSGEANTWRWKENGLGGKYTMPHIGDLLQNDTLEIHVILLTNTRTNLI